MLQIPNIAEMGQYLLIFLKYAVPGILVIVALVSVAKMMTWGKSVMRSAKEVSSSPFAIIFFASIALLLLYIWFSLSGKVGL